MNLTFQTSAGQYTGAILPLYAGDTWSLAITGAQANAPVAVSGSMPGATFNDTAMGHTDAGGNFSLSGTITPDQSGEWREMWTVGGVPVGGFGFSVNAGSRKPNQSVPPTTPILPMNTGFQNTADILKNSPGYAGGSGGGQSLSPCQFYQRTAADGTCTTNTTLLLLSAAVGLFLLGGKR
jgi:hypothetical protein